MIFLILKTHRPLHFRTGIDESAQNITGQRVIVAARVYILELAGLVIAALRVGPLKQKTLNFVGGVQRVTLLLVEVIRIGFQNASDVSTVRCPAFVDDIAEHQHFAGSKDVRRTPIKSAPVDSETEIALALCRKAADGRTIKCKIVPTL